MTLFLCVTTDTTDKYLLNNSKAIWQMNQLQLQCSFRQGIHLPMVTLQCPLLVPLIVQVAYFAAPVT